MQHGNIDVPVQFIPAQAGCRALVQVILQKVVRLLISRLFATDVQAAFVAEQLRAQHLDVADHRWVVQDRLIHTGIFACFAQNRIGVRQPLQVCIEPRVCVRASDFFAAQELTF